MSSDVSSAPPPPPPPAPEPQQWPAPPPISEWQTPTPKPGDPDYQWSLPGTAGPQTPAQADASWGAPAPKPNRRKRTSIGGLAAFFVASAIVRTFLWSGVDAAEGALRDPLYTPKQVGTATRMLSGEARDIEADMKSDFTSKQKAQAGIYGRNGRPLYGLLSAYSPEKNAQEVLSGFMAEDEASVGAPKLMPSGVLCATLTTEGTKGAVCAWGGDKSDGVLWSYTRPNLDALAKLTAQARADVETGKAAS